MKRMLRSIVPTAVCLLFALTLTARAEEKAAPAEQKKVDPTGTWTWTVTGRDGTPRTVTAKLKVDDGKLTGTISGRQADTAIEDAKLAGEDLSFKVTREFNGTKFVQKFSGKISGDAIKGKIESERDGETRSVDWDAKRGAAKSEAVNPPVPPAQPAQP
jgi:hypothetical protein